MRLSDEMLEEALKDCERLCGPEVADGIRDMEMSITDAEEREILIERIVDDTREYISISPAPQPALLALIDAQLTALSKEWAMSREQLLNALRSETEIILAFLERVTRRANQQWMGESPRPKIKKRTPEEQEAWEEWAAEWLDALGVEMEAYK